MHFNTDDTICSIITPPGLSGVALLRISGNDASTIINKHVHFDITEKSSHSISYGIFYRNDIPVDTITLFWYKGPNSFTGQDIIEIGCHGGYIVPEQILQCLISSGARRAEPGEFSLRAFLNGKLDLTQAEAINDIIHLQSPAALESASKQLIGSFKKEIISLKDKTEKLFKYLILDFDFSQEDIELVSHDTLVQELTILYTVAQSFIRTFDSAKTLRSGYNVLLLGYPNAGKSSLFNALLGYSRSIVSPIPGTTRDFVEASLLIDGLHVNIIDTAGIHENTKDIIEIEGISLSMNLINKASIICIVNDITCGIHNSDQLYKIAKELNSDADMCFIHNKADKMIDEYINDSQNIYSSVPHNYGLQDILNYISRCISKTDIHMSFLLNQRQVDLLKDYQNNIYSALELAKNGETTDVLAVDLRSALDSLGLIIGTIYNEDLLNDVFASMCIGK